MSFILRFFHHPEARTVRAAAAVIDKLPDSMPGASARFDAFRTAISEYYPDLSASEDEVDNNLWPEGLPTGPVDDGVVNLLVETDLMDPGVMSVIAREAIGAGLQILDEQNGLLYGPGLEFIGLDDAKPQPLPAITPYARSVMTENLRGLGLAASQAMIADALAESLGGGFRREDGRDGSVLWREHGELRQILQLSVMRSTDKVSARVYCLVGFACDGLSAIWLPLLPTSFLERQQKFDQVPGGRAPQYRAWLPRLDSGEVEEGLQFRTTSRMEFRDEPTRAKLIADARHWAAGKLRDYLDGIASPDDLQRLFIRPATLPAARSAGMFYPVHLAMLALARRAGLAELDAYAAAYRANPDFGRVCRLYKDPAGSHLDQLVAGLRERPTGSGA
jgi:hypothetical protein